MGSPENVNLKFRSIPILAITMKQITDYKTNNLRRIKLLNYLKYYTTKRKMMEHVFWDLIDLLDNYQSITPRQFEVILPYLRKEQRFVRSTDEFIHNYFKVFIKSKYRSDITHLLIEPEYNGATLEPFFS